jgi:transposase
VIAIEVVRKIADQVGFVVLPRRWVVERFFAWINRNRRLAKDFEATVASAEAFLYAVSVMLLTHAWRTRNEFRVGLSRCI